MYILDTGARFSAVRFSPVFNPPPTSLRRRYFIVRANLPFPKHQAKYHKELEVAIDAVDRACRLCVDVKRSLFSSKEKIVEKNDQTPVTIADFGVQALVSLELSKLFPSIPLVAEEDSHFVRANNLVSSVVSEVKSKASIGDNHLSDADVLEAIDRGGKDAYTFCNKPATYWVLDPIDGTRGFLKGDEALYVVGLALVVDNEIVLGVMGCPNWPGDSSDGSTGTLMLSHIGCGTWTKKLQNVSGNVAGDWIRCFVDACVLMNKARFCIQESQTWESLPLSGFFDASTVSEDLKHKEILLLPTCCGSLCKYLMVASGRASVFLLRAKTQRTIKSWDHAVGIICVHEAGGKVTDWEGDEINLEEDQSERRLIFPAGGVVVSNGSLHNQILEMISSASPTL
ncbi:3'(2'), 5'-BISPHOSPHATE NUCLEOTIDASE-like protein [Arabidopsis thaliana]|jgi:3'(2'), 5'-bisphosphate nucleotidase|uniref:Putative 3'(2'),5'-bisphosphate nucleotidase, mitochondrial n=3 Tax=Arabidopsis thaliana TaxID=3702 RepID=DPNPM_ARATH|nr:Inositol monophosphatase family protein [Arabidopsis thaliana]Q9M0Y6.1 RecName: Full=Putative PAP-specific phosphatase, mitochondrial; AltName: Full=3'(2'),5'-bisphosphate nucleotidase; AltName: Full=3'(2'),5-bisphosphonucleoside 3'(2')-phosphohydrolase; AltName: Full=DPNPase; Flags: Precursor [Arabidopsis thaliana]AAM62812.1 3(2),5-BISPHOSPHATE NUCLEOTIDASE-like protein [Arabidopsis thaliana]AEE82476.1 Inositol monophosphatase family protein [Arabidopsis thaliana]CAA0393620.1 unnamed protei|eukprot:NP_192418.1 Inositol monophosphatase family protein [Arabidopsis thaliana]